MIESVNVAAAIHEIKPNSDFSVGETYSSLIWDEGQEQVKPTEKEFNDAVTAWNAEYDTQEYARNRKKEYDALNQFELISDDTKNGTTTHIDAIEVIKAKWPKDNSGPV